MLLPVSGFSHSETSLLFISRKGVIGRFISAVHTALHVQYLRMLPQCQEFLSLLCHCCMLWLLTRSLDHSFSNRIISLLTAAFLEVFDTGTWMTIEVLQPPKQKWNIQYGFKVNVHRPRSERHTTNGAQLTKFKWRNFDLHYWCHIKVNISFEQAYKFAPCHGSCFKHEQCITLYEPATWFVCTTSLCKVISEASQREDAAE